ncbi:nitric oxide reductase activation protein NorD [Paenibacillus sp. FJAT-26967]|uniref:nitric oxide reductase activation protein NorD n=1 Tax=Paenibacillus sp. FJAT-26967 TaxID=1729690 RepID=UPI0008382B2A|nr:hypothetical protein [Paenibacillus sp. FJAT-26967]
MFVGKVHMLDNKMDAFLLMQLVDLARMFARNAELRVELAFHSNYEESESLLTISQFWRDWKPAQREAGMKSDVYLRAIGSAWYTGREDTDLLLAKLADSPLSRFGSELFTLCEDIRLEAICRRIRPGTSEIFNQREHIYRGYFRHKLTAHQSRGETADALFLAVYYWFKGAEQLTGAAGTPLQTQSVEFSSEVDTLIRLLHPYLEEAERAESTARNAELCLDMLEILAYRLDQDAVTAYFSTRAGSGAEMPLLRGSEPPLRRTKPLANDDAEQESKAGRDMNRRSERLSMWHRETPDTEGQAMRHALERGTRTARFSGEAVQAGDDGASEAMAVAKGRSAVSNRPSEAPPKDAQPLSSAADPAAGSGESAPQLRAVAERLAARKPTLAEEAAYREAVSVILPLTKQLTRTVRLTLERKHTAPRRDLLYGRLGRKLVRFATDEAPRLFTKKRDPASDLDAAFSLLVDCSASMYDKMEETRLGISLVHETLRTLRIPHEVTGFWEDAERVSAEEAPNVFHTVVDFGACLAPRSGPALLQLEPQQDNRDGFAIRHAARRLLRRPEKQRVLLVFSDGEPSAAEYHEAGILDTYEAVLECRRLGIDVISVFLASGEVHETQRITMRNIYGRHGIVVPHASELPQHLAPLLRKLLLRSEV